jgi:hypothetical protein
VMMAAAEDEAETAARAASFDEAQRLGSELAETLTESCSRGEPMPEEAVRALRALVSHTAGGRGWFVSLLTNPDYEPIFKPPLDPQLLSAIEASPDPNVKLLTMNVAMSTATELVHKANGDDDLAAASRLTRAPKPRPFDRLCLGRFRSQILMTVFPLFLRRPSVLY